MTAGTNGNGGGATPESDDPFAYLYRQDGDDAAAGQGGGAAPGGPQQPQYGQPGVPRTSYHQVTRVGQTQRPGGYGYPQQAASQQAAPAQPGYGQQAYGQPQQPGAGGAYGQSAQPSYAPPAPPTQPGRRAAGGGGRGGGSRGLLIAAVGVVVAVAVGIAAAVWAGGDGGDEAKDEPSSSPSTGQSRSQQPTRSAEPQPEDEIPGVTDANTMVRGGGAQLSTEYGGALSKNGEYIAGMDSEGSSVTWKFTMPEEGQYRLNVRYGNAGDDAKATLVVNGKPQSIDLKNYTKQKEWENAWTRSFGLVNLAEGENTVALTCASGDKCGFVVDQMAVTEGDYPSTWP